MSEKTEQTKDPLTEEQLRTIENLVSTDSAYVEFYAKLLNELKTITNKEGKATLPYKYLMGKAIAKARREWEKTHPAIGPTGWTIARHAIMNQLRHDLGVSRPDLYACLRFVELGIRRKDGWKSWDEFKEKKFQVLRGGSPQGETPQKVRGDDLTWKEVKEQVLRGKKRAKVEPEQSEVQSSESRETIHESATPTCTLPEIPLPKPILSSEMVFTIELPISVLQTFRKIAKPSAEEVLANFIRSIVDASPES
jgi:hypothetical protein